MDRKRGEVSDGKACRSECCAVFARQPPARNWNAIKMARISQFERISPRSARMASTSKSPASGTCADRNDAQVKMDGGTYGL